MFFLFQLCLHSLYEVITPQSIPKGNSCFSYIHPPTYCLILSPKTAVPKKLYFRSSKIVILQYNINSLFLHYPQRVVFFPIRKVSKNPSRWLSKSKRHLPNNLYAWGLFCSCKISVFHWQKSLLISIVSFLDSVHLYAFMYWKYSTTVFLQKYTKKSPRTNILGGCIPYRIVGTVINNMYS